MTSHSIGTGYVLPATGHHGAETNYPHARIVPLVTPASSGSVPASTSASGQAPTSGSPRGSGNTRLVFVSGTSSRRADGSYEGCVVRADGTYALDCGMQTAATLRTIEAVLRGASGGSAGLDAVVDATVFLTDVRADYAAMNAAWDRVWHDRTRAPARTCVQVAALPSERLCVEIKCQAVLIG